MTDKEAISLLRSAQNELSVLRQEAALIQHRLEDQRKLVDEIVARIEAGAVRVAESAYKHGEE